MVAHSTLLEISCHGSYNLTASVVRNFKYFQKQIEMSLQIQILKLIPVIPVLSDHSKIDKIKVFKTNGSLMKVKSIAECSLGAFCNTFDLH